MREEMRENWGSRAGFVLAAIGSAVGLGNLWGFPYKLYSYGGGAFLIPYVIAMLLIGLPLLIAEFSLGHLTQRAAPDAFGRINRKYAFVGWWQIVLSFVIITYYAVILAWCLSFLYYSVVGIFQGSLPWAGEGLEGVTRAKEFFFDKYLNFNESFSLGKIQWHIVLALVITWLAMYLCICRGVKTVSKVVLWTVPLPWLMLLILTIRGLTLEGAVQGLEYYLEPNWSRLTDPETWRWGFGQMFFSMSLAFGVMITYASFLHRKSDLNNNAAIIGLADMGTSFVAGLAVFATLGGMAFATRMAGAGVPVEEVAKSGPGLAFVAFPYALAQLPHAAWFSLIFFSSLLLLGIDSAFSITESVLASIVDKTGWNRTRTLIVMSLVGLLIGLIFCTQGGLNWLGSFDGFVNGTWGITLAALLECLVLGWLFRLRRLREHANERSDWRLGRWWDWNIRLVIPVVLAGLFAWSLFDSLASPGGYAYSYKAQEVSVDLPAVRDIPEDGILELQFVANFNSKAEHEFKLDDTNPAKSAQGWKIGGAEDGEALLDDFKAGELKGKVLAFSTDSLTPGTAYSVRYRWNQRPKIDPRTGLAITAPEDQQPRWVKLTELRTASTRAGVNVGNTAGLCLMAIAPILAVVITSARFKHAEPDETLAINSPSPSQSRVSGMIALLCGLAGGGLLLAALVKMLPCSAAIRAGLQTAQACGQSGAMFHLIAGGLASILALLIGWTRVARCERSGSQAGLASHMGAGLGVLSLGLCGGLALAYTMMAKSFQVQPIEYDNQLSGVSYVVLSVMLGLIVIGLCLCFYRAIKSAVANSDQQ